MASTANLRFRRSAAQLHALAGVEREIRAQDSHYRRKYLREFSQSFREYDCVLDPQRLDQAIQRADIVLIGDYHALPAAQHYAAAAVEQRALAGDRPVVLGVETTFWTSGGGARLTRTNCASGFASTLTGGTIGLPSVKSWRAPGTTPRHSTVSIACRGTTCEELDCEIATPAQKSWR